MNKINGNALSGYQESNLGEMGDNLVHNGSFIHPGPGLLDYTCSKDNFGLGHWEWETLSTLTRDLLNRKSVTGNYYHSFSFSERLA